MRHGMVQTAPVFDAANDGTWMAPGPIGHLNADGAKNQSKPPKIFTASIIQKQLTTATQFIKDKQNETI
jgi:hypothetical protein